MYWLTALLAIVVVFARDFGWKAYVHMRQPKLYHIHAEIQKFGPPGTKAGGAEVVHAAEEGLPDAGLDASLSAVPQPQKLVLHHIDPELEGMHVDLAQGAKGTSNVRNPMGLDASGGGPQKTVPPAPPATPGDKGLELSPMNNPTTPPPKAPPRGGDGDGSDYHDQRPSVRREDTSGGRHDHELGFAFSTDTKTHAAEIEHAKSRTSFPQSSRRRLAPSSLPPARARAPERRARPSGAAPSPRRAPSAAPTPPPASTSPPPSPRTPRHRRTAPPGTARRRRDMPHGASIRLQLVASSSNFESTRDSDRA